MLVIEYLAESIWGTSVRDTVVESVCIVPMRWGIECYEYVGADGLRIVAGAKLRLLPRSCSACPGT